MPKGVRNGGRQKGTPNKIKGAHQDFLDAWKKCAGPQTALRLMKDAIQKFSGYTTVEKTYEFVPDKKGRRRRTLVKEKVRTEYNAGPLEAILPYIAKRQPQQLEVGGEDGEPIKVELVPFPANANRPG